MIPTPTLFKICINKSSKINHILVLIQMRKIFAHENEKQKGNGKVNFINIYKYFEQIKKEVNS